MVKTIHQTITFNAPPHDVYEMLIDEEKHAGFSGAPAEISRKVGGKFKCYGDFIEGKNVEITQDVKIVQKWRGKDWPKGHFSTATFEFEETPDGGTRLIFTQTDVPDNQVEHISKGWHDHYWDKIKEHL